MQAGLVRFPLGGGKSRLPRRFATGVSVVVGHGHRQTCALIR